MLALTAPIAGAAEPADRAALEKQLKEARAKLNAAARDVAEATAALQSAQERVAEQWTDAADWTRKAVLNVARMGKFSSDRTIREYAREIWHLAPVPPEAPPR